MMHYQRWKNNGDPLVALKDRQGTRDERFWRKINKDGPVHPTLGPCWEWTKALDRDGYGHARISGKNYAAHRFAYESAGGEIPDGLELDHLCRNRKCVNPGHLEPVTARVNNMRGYGICSINSRKTHCPKGHPLDGDNLYRTPSDYRVCRRCKRENEKKRKQAARRQKELCGHTGH